jgi:hypothetical protein
LCCLRNCFPMLSCPRDVQVCILERLFLMDGVSLLCSSKSMYESNRLWNSLLQRYNNRYSKESARVELFAILKNGFQWDLELESVYNMSYVCQVQKLRWIPGFAIGLRILEKVEQTNHNGGFFLLVSKRATSAWAAFKTAVIRVFSCQPAIRQKRKNLQASRCCAQSCLRFFGFSRIFFLVFLREWLHAGECNSCERMVVLQVTQTR